MTRWVHRHCLVGVVGAIAIGASACVIETRPAAPAPQAHVQPQPGAPNVAPSPTAPHPYVPPHFVPPPAPNPVSGCRPRKTPPPNGTGEWMAWTTNVGWLHVGTKNELARPQPMSEEIWGGGSNAPLVKTAVLGPFASREQALEEIVSRLVGVQREWNASAVPREIVVATFNGARLRMRLDRGNAPDSVIWTGQEYDFNAELAIALGNGVSPRIPFAKLQYLVHATGMGTMDGPRKLDQWMTLTTAPQGGRFTISDGSGGTFGYSCDAVEGPFADNFAMVPALKRHGIPYVYESGSGRTVSTTEVVDPVNDRGVPLCAR